MTEASRVQKLLSDQNAEIDRLKNRIETLEAALADIQLHSSDDWAKEEARLALEGKDD
jgi:tmRNA-binding protein